MALRNLQPVVRQRGLVGLSTGVASSDPDGRLNDLDVLGSIGDDGAFWMN